MSSRHKPNIFWFIALGCLSLGCEAGHHQAIRPKAPADPTSWSGSPITDRSESPEDGGTGAAKGFLKSSRLPGALSSEGSEIERSLGVGR